jgi:hypothetical protein
MDENLYEKMMSSFLLWYHHLLVKWPIVYDYNFFQIKIEVISYNYSQLYTHLTHIVIGFLVVKDIIPSNECAYLTT